MTWALGPDISRERIRDWEATINQIFTPGLPARMICQYSRSRLTPDVVESSLSTHPLAIIGNDVYPNHFYETPPILDGKTKRGKLDWMISQLEIMRRQERDRHSEQTSKLQHIFQLNDQVNRAEDLEEIYKTSLDIILRAAKADRSAILLMDDNQVMRFKKWRGLSEKYRRAVEDIRPGRPTHPIHNRSAFMISMLRQWNPLLRRRCAMKESMRSDFSHWFIRPPSWEIHGLL